MARDNDPAHEAHRAAGPYDVGGAVAEAAELLRQAQLARQLIVLQLLGKGYTRAQVAALLGVSTEVLAGVERSVCARLGGATVEEAVEVARRRGFIL